MTVHSSDLPQGAALEPVATIAPPAKRPSLVTLARRYPTIALGGLMLLIMVFVAIFAPLLGTTDPTAISTRLRTREPSALYWFGTDMLGRDVYSRVVFGARVSLVVGLAVAIFATIVGLAIGLVTGYVRALDAVVMRVMDGLMSIPSVLLAIALMALTKASMVDTF